jgi:hypothetical protein
MNKRISTAPSSVSDFRPRAAPEARMASRRAGRSTTTWPKAAGYPWATCFSRSPAT